MLCSLFRRLDGEALGGEKAAPADSGIEKESHIKEGRRWQFLKKSEKQLYGIFFLLLSILLTICLFVIFVHDGL